MLVEIIVEDAYSKLDEPLFLEGSSKDREGRRQVPEIPL